MSWIFVSEYLTSQPKSKKLFTDDEYSFTIFDLKIPSVISVLGDVHNKHGIVSGCSYFGDGRIVAEGVAAFLSISDYIYKNSVIPYAKIIYVGQSGDEATTPQVVIDLENIYITSIFVSYSSENSSVLQQFTFIQFVPSVMSVQSNNLDGEYGGNSPYECNISNTTSSSS